MAGDDQDQNPVWLPEPQQDLSNEKHFPPSSTSPLGLRPPPYLADLTATGPWAGDGQEDHPFASTPNSLHPTGAGVTPYHQAGPENILRPPVSPTRPQDGVRPYTRYEQPTTKTAAAAEALRPPVRPTLGKSRLPVHSDLPMGPNHPQGIHEDEPTTINLVKGAQDRDKGRVQELVTEALREDVGQPGLLTKEAKERQHWVDSDTDDDLVGPSAEDSFSFTKFLSYFTEDEELELEEKPAQPRAFVSSGEDPLYAEATNVTRPLVLPVTAPQSGASSIRIWLPILLLSGFLAAGAR